MFGEQRSVKQRKRSSLTFLCRQM